MVIRQSPEPEYPEYGELRAAADRRAGPFVDPVDVHHRIPALVDRRGHDWVRAVLGRGYGGPAALYGSDMELLKLADERGLDPPLPAHIVAARAAARAREEEEERRRAELIRLRDAEWDALREALPVRVDVYHNYTSHRHYDGYVQGVDHIVVKEELHVGRLHRDKGRPLCWTPSRADDLVVFDDPGDHRRPECKACIRTACRLTGVEAPTLLSRQGRW
jgi:hypothetical protein